MPIGWVIDDPLTIFTIICRIVNVSGNIEYIMFKFFASNSHICLKKLLKIRTQIRILIPKDNPCSFVGLEIQSINWLF